MLQLSSNVAFGVSLENRSASFCRKPGCATPASMLLARSKVLALLRAAGGGMVCGMRSLGRKFRGAVTDHGIASGWPAGGFMVVVTPYVMEHLCGETPPGSCMKVGGKRCGTDVHISFHGSS